MATVFGEPEAHPVAALVARFHADLDQLGDPRLWSISDTELADTLTDTLDLGASHGGCCPCTRRGGVLTTRVDAASQLHAPPGTVGPEP